MAPRPRPMGRATGRRRAMAPTGRRHTGHRATAHRHRGMGHRHQGMARHRQGMAHHPSAMAPRPAMGRAMDHQEDHREDHQAMDHLATRNWHVCKRTGCKLVKIWNSDLLGNSSLPGAERPREWQI